ncbi:sodium:solute symporter family protein [Roseateles puraquae]|jgi:solute:Na+ symporter, SSS family|uniref:Sodium:solute symporter n=1 Tax=Roseateles puraquae TaxID=431059 RepID=A0A254N601_9BURK|nr:sodium:solute symporter family protein [Roseateles puraquae]MCF8204631.1 sodium:solute symporter family protein [Methylotenera sp.]MDG0854021.1 sodium:solute symporter [Roseateles puraquae]OWR03486.1 sodium:solute symporter [Roseateles puraquae]
MNTTLIVFVVLYLLGTLAIGVWAGTRVKNTSDFAVAGRSLPLIMVITTTFATWFGAETVMGIPAKFVQGGLNAIIEDPFGAGLCLVLVGAFFAAKLYQKNLLTIGDFYRQRYGKGVEIFCSLAIILSYLGWVAAQVTALGLVFNILTNGAMSPQTGMIVGLLAVLIYVVIGGFLAVAWTDFIQMIVLVIGLSVIAVFSADLAGGAGVVLNLAASKDLGKFLPEPSFTQIAMFLGAALTMMLGSIPQQDVFQRVMSAKDAKTAQRGAIIGGFSYIAFAFVPMFIVLAAVAVMGDKALDLAQNDYQRVLPTFIMGHMPLLMQILFFGALLSAIKSTSSATLLAPTTSFVENILKQIRPGMSDRQQLVAMRVTLVIFAACVLAYSIALQGTPIYEMVSAAYQVTLVAAFVPLVFGLYWSRATTQGAIFSIFAGIAVWVAYFPQVTTWGEFFPGQLAGLIAALIGMLVGSLMPQILTNRHEHVSHHLQPHP